MERLQDKIDKEKFIDLYINQRLTMQKVADILNIKYSAVNTLKNLWKINRKDDSDRKILNRELLIELYINKNMGKWEIANYLNISYCTVNKNLKRYNILSHETEEIVDKMATDYKNGLSLTQLSKKYNRPKSRIRNVLLNAGVKFRDKHNCHYNDIGGEILNSDIFRSKKATVIKRKIASHFKTHISIPMKKEHPWCSICGEKEHLHVHHLMPLSIIINKIVDENKNISDDELYQKVITDKRYLNKENMIVVCEKCHYTIFHPYINYQANKQPSLNKKEGSETIF